MPKTLLRHVVRVNNYFQLFLCAQTTQPFTSHTGREGILTCGRGAAGKTPVIGIVERGGKIIAKVVPSVTTSNVFTNISRRRRALREDGEADEMTLGNEREVSVPIVRRK
jgi:hypothetical protein